MTLTSEYCREKKHLEQCSWYLVSKLHALTDRLMALVGKDHAEFLITKDKCARVKLDLIESHDRLRAHCSAHGC